MEVRIPKSWAWLAPLQVDGLIRLGGERDGGYVIPEALIRDASALVSMGLGYDWQFEKHVKRVNPSIRVQVYDHTVSEKQFRRDLISEAASLLAGQTRLAMVKRRYERVRDYRRFFSADVVHFRERIHDRSEKGSVDIATVFERAGSGDLFVKMDIEGSEYRVLPDVIAKADRITGLAIEFHDIGPLRPVFEQTMAALCSRFEIVHVHANNFIPAYRDGLPEALEITLARRGLVQGADRRSELPLPELDRPNDPGRPDYKLVFA